MSHGSNSKNILFCDVSYDMKENVAPLNIFCWLLNINSICFFLQLFSVKQTNPLGIRFVLLAFPLLCPTQPQNVSNLSFY